MLMSMKSTPSGRSFTPASSSASISARENLSTWAAEAGPAAPLIQENECLMFSFLSQGECFST